MNIFFILSLFVFGTLFGSFASVIIYRIKSGKTGILTGRSQCKTCQKTLSPRELIPIISWFLQGRKCRGCQKNIPMIYPLLEFTTGILLSGVGIFLLSPELIIAGDILEWSRLVFFCILMVLTVIYVFYDILYLEIPEGIVIGANILVLSALIAQGFGAHMIPYLPVGYIDMWSIIYSLGIIGILYGIVFARLHEFYDCLLLGVCIIALYFFPLLSKIPLGQSALVSGTIAALGIYSIFFLQILVSRGRAMGAGDLRIAILMGLVCGVTLAFPAFMICYLIGSIIGIGILIYQKSNQPGNIHRMYHKIPFGPFIASGYIMILFFYPQILQFIEWYIY